MSTTNFSGPVNSTAGFTQGAAGVATTAETLTALSTLTIDDHGKTFFLNATDGFTTTLPAVTLTGFRCKFVVQAVFANTSMVIASAEGDNINGIMADMGATPAGIPASGEDFINHVHSAETVGDWTEFVSNGTNWFVTGMCAANGGLTATDPS